MESEGLAAHMASKPSMMYGDGSGNTIKHYYAGSKPKIKSKKKESK